MMLSGHVLKSWCMMVSTLGLLAISSATALRVMIKILLMRSSAMQALAEWPPQRPLAPIMTTFIVLYVVSLNGDVGGEVNQVR